MKRHTSMRGLIVDMDKLRYSNQNTIAIGNGRMNARGDLLTAGGSVLVKREQLNASYNQNNTNSVKKSSIREMPDQWLTIDDISKAIKEKKNTGTDLDQPVLVRRQPRKDTDDTQRDKSASK